MAAPPNMARVRVVMVGAVVAVFLLTYVDLLREQKRVLDDFAGEQAALARGVAATLAARTDGILRDASAAAEAASSSGAEGEGGGGGAPAALARLVGAGERYRELDVLDERGEPELELLAPGATRLAESPELVKARAEIFAALSAGNSGEQPLAVSGPLARPINGGSERPRLFAAKRGGRAVVLLVDGARLFDAAELTEAAVPVRWLVTDDEQRWLDVGGDPAAGDAQALQTLRAAASGPVPQNARVPSETKHVESGTVAELLARMRAGERGALFLDRAQADSLGLERRSAIAGFAKVPLHGVRPWSVAVVVSARRVRDRARLGAWRLAASTGLAAVVVAAFGLFAARQQRRGQALSQALELAEATSALRERAQKIVETIPIGVLGVAGEKNARVTSVNPYLAERGVRAAATLAESLGAAADDEAALLEALVAEARAERRPAQKLGATLHLGGGGARDVDLYAVPLERPLADADCFVVLHDRTETRSLERNLQRADKLATIGTLAAGVAHEVGTPLGIISGRAEQLLARVPDGEAGEAMRKHVASILAQVDKVSTTIRQLLDFSRTRTIETAAVSPAQALGQAQALLDHRFRHAKVTLTVDAPPSVPALAADAGQLEQVLVNLLINACDACAAGGHVVARASADGEKVAIEIADDGAGIAPENLARVLDPFFTTKKRGQGTGLGLTIAGDIVKNHGGTLELDSAPGRGTTVRVLWPAAKGAA